jgi:hypothetical protein
MKEWRYLAREEGDGSGILYDFKLNRFFLLNSTACRILMLSKHPPEEIAKKLVHIYDISKERALEETSSFLHRNAEVIAQLCFRRLGGRKSSDSYPLSSPLFVDFYPSFRCPMRCVFCYLPNHHTPEMSLEDALQVVDKLERGKVFFINLLGGEPLMLKWLPQFLAYVGKKKIGQADKGVRARGDTPLHRPHALQPPRLRNQLPERPRNHGHRREWREAEG